MACNSKFGRAEILKGWLELTRPPNLFTVPGDVLAGASMAFVTRNETPLILPTIIISVFLYMSGLILNDFFDRKIDSMERPNRPIPSGRISPDMALISAISLILIALALSSISARTFLITLSLIFLILFYNSHARKIPLLGIIIMGLCRGINLILGASFCPNPFNNIVLTGAGLETLYIASVSSLAYHEIKGQPGGIKLWLPSISLVISLPILLIISKSALFGIFMSFLAVSWIFFIQLQFRFKKNEKNLPQSIGDLIRSLILIQCAMIAASINRNPAYRIYYLMGIILLFVFFILSDLSAKKFYGS